jgi:lipoprotein NlpD
MGCIGKKISIVILLALFTAICSCSSNVAYAPVVEGAYQTTPSGLYRVKGGDTLYSIAWAFGQDYRVLAKWNHITPPYAIRSGQYIIIKKTVRRQSREHIIRSEGQITAKVVNVRHAHSNGTQNISARIEHSINRSQNSSKVRWQWPAQGKVVSTFAPSIGKKGIDIIGKLDSPVYATAGGIVVYSGNGLAGYGNLIIIKHNADYLSAYADNSQLLVHEGQSVQAGQQIAKMGKAPNDQIKLHFEIRRAGAPIDPLKFLPRH